MSLKRHFLPRLRATYLSVAIVIFAAAIGVLFYPFLDTQAARLPEGIRIGFIPLADEEKRAVDEVIAALPLAYELPSIPRGDYYALQFTTGGKSPKTEVDFAALKRFMAEAQDNPSKQNIAEAALRRIDQLKPFDQHRSPTLLRAVALTWANRPAEAQGALDQFMGKSAGLGRTVDETAEIALFSEYLRAQLDMRRNGDLRAYVKASANLLGTLEKRASPGFAPEVGLSLRASDIAYEHYAARAKLGSSGSVSAREAAYEATLAEMQKKALLAQTTIGTRSDMAYLSCLLRFRLDRAQEISATCLSRLGSDGRLAPIMEVRKLAREGSLGSNPQALGPALPGVAEALVSIYAAGDAPEEVRSSIREFFRAQADIAWRLRLRVLWEHTLAALTMVLAAFVLLTFSFILDREIRRVFVAKYAQDPAR